MRDLIIVGGGPAGAAAAVYAARKRLNTVLITPSFEGQSVVSEKIENWIGDKAISGQELAKKLREHVVSYTEHPESVLEVVEKDKVTYVTKKRGGFKVVTEGGKEYEALSVLITAGSSRRRLLVPGTDRFEHKGIVYCASCDGPLFAGMDVIVVGAGNAAFETAAQLLAYATSVTLIHRGDNFERADAVTVEKVLAHPNMKVKKNSQVVAINGQSFVESVTIKNTLLNTEEELPAKGVFIEIGSTPNTDMVADVVKRDQWNHIVTNPKNQRTSKAGIWAAGDCTDGLFHQNNIAVGDAVKALEDIFLWIHQHKNHKV